MSYDPLIWIPPIFAPTESSKMFHSMLLSALFPPRTLFSVDYPSSTRRPDYVPPQVLARRAPAHVVVPTDLDDHWIPDDEPSWRRFLPETGGL